MEELQEKLEKVKDFRPIDDVFFEVLAQNIGVCQEILRVILEDDDLIVNSVITQSSERNLCGRSVRLDALCTLGNGTKCNIEVQRSNNDNHLRRARFNASMITITDSMLMYGKEASNRKQEIERQHYTIPNQRPKNKHCGKI